MNVVKKLNFSFVTRTHFYRIVFLKIRQNIEFVTESISLSQSVKKPNHYLLFSATEINHVFSILKYIEFKLG